MHTRRLPAHGSVGKSPDAGKGKKHYIFTSGDPHVLKPNFLRSLLGSAEADSEAVALTVVIALLVRSSELALQLRMLAEQLFIPVSTYPFCNDQR